MWVSNSFIKVVRDFFKNVALRVFNSRLLEEIHHEWRAIAVTISNFVLPWRRIRIARFAKLTGLKLNIGCGAYNPSGWCGVDVVRGSDLRIDVRRGLPLMPGSCRFIFTEHYLEHLELHELRELLRDCWRVLEPAGAIRIVVPDLEKYARAYLQGDRSFMRIVSPTAVSMSQVLNGVFSVASHRFIHDYETIRAELLLAGFSEVWLSAYRDSRFSELNIDSGMAQRRVESLYVEAARV
jgi:predicted SAM-dependent methyltransferase